MRPARYWVVTDLETTGLNEQKHEIIQIARTVVDTASRQIVPGSQFNIYVTPSQWEGRDRKAMAINRIQKSTLNSVGVDLYSALGDYSRHINWSESILAAWGIDFELKFLHAAHSKTMRVVPFNYQTFDVRSAAFLHFAQDGLLEYPGLAEAAEAFGLDVDHNRLHDAVYDVELTAEIVLALLRV